MKTLWGIGRSHFSAYITRHTRRCFQKCHNTSMKEHLHLKSHASVSTIRYYTRQNQHSSVDGNKISLVTVFQKKIWRKKKEEKKTSPQRLRKYPNRSATIVATERGAYFPTIAANSRLSFSSAQNIIHATCQDSESSFLVCGTREQTERKKRASQRNPIEHLSLSLRIDPYLKVRRLCVYIYTIQWNRSSLLASFFCQVFSDDTKT